MGKPTGFLEHERETAARRPPRERIGDFREVELPFPEEKAREQAARCMDCGVPFCHDACPLHNVIPDFADLVHRGQLDEAAARLDETNNFPELTGRLCPAPCEAACVVGIHALPVSIKQIEHTIADHVTARPLVPRPAATSTGKRVGIVGSGPAGLACAQELARRGHAVVVYERADRPGGLLRYGIPDFKMSKSILDARLDQLRAEGVVFRCGVDVGRDLDAEALLASHDAIGLAVGALAPRGLDVPGADLPGVVAALDYLTQENRIQAGDVVDPRQRISAEGRRVVILGGGDTGADCLGTAHRQGAASIVQLEIAPRPPDARAPEDPWPRWPTLFRVSPAHEEGGDRDFALRTTRIEGIGGRAGCLVSERVRWDGGRIVGAGEEIVFDTDLVLVATGYTGPEASPLHAALGIALDPRGRLAADDEGRTAQPHLFAMGDARRGASLIVWAIAEGRRAARSIDRHLVGKRYLPTAPASSRAIAVIT